MSHAGGKINDIRLINYALICIRDGFVKKPTSYCVENFISFKMSGHSIGKF